jgi:hypothetical protein
MAERGIQHNPDRHAAYLGSWINAMKQDKHEIFRAARDAHRAADFLIALEHYKSIDQALAHVNALQPGPAPAAAPPMRQVIQAVRDSNRGLELER